MKEKILSIINKYTPRADYLAHYYWGDNTHNFQVDPNGVIFNRQLC